MFIGGFFGVFFTKYLLIKPPSTNIILQTGTANSYHIVWHSTFTIGIYELVDCKNTVLNYGFLISSLKPRAVIGQKQFQCSATSLMQELFGTTVSGAFLLTCVCVCVCFLSCLPQSPLNTLSHTHAQRSMKSFDS